MAFELLVLRIGRIRVLELVSRVGVLIRSAGLSLVSILLVAIQESDVRSAAIGPGICSLSRADSSAVISRTAASGRWPRPVDVNGDGSADALVGAYNYSPP